ncbi:serine hydrolase [Paenibacillus sanguinis]|uniref:serine hydrolase n=1 Tax=Paenibacillus sanguinis TaxID=225906 RepID=UPI00035FF0A4|nr:serine hydrolase [Paenibacillus sanguinis]
MSKNMLKGLGETIQTAMTEMNVPGAQVAIVKNGEVIYSEAFGYANLQREISLTPGHMLPIGSSSKSFTATAIAMLVQEGKLDLDMPMRTYLPEFELADPVATLQATPRDLLCHRTGLPRHEMLWFNRNDLDRKDLAENLIRHLPANAPFRSRWQYQNSMYSVLGHLIEKVSGLPWETFVEERIFAPLGIQEYSFRIPYPDESGKYASLYTPDEKGVNQENVPLIIDAMGPAGSINLPAEELAKWLVFNLNSGQAGGKALLDATLLKELHTPNIPYQLLPFELPERVNAGYALGWMVDYFRGHKLVDHGGNVNGGSALISLLPDQEIGCAILTNANGNLFGTALSMEIYDRCLGVDDGKNWFHFYQEGMNSLLTAMKGTQTDIYDTKLENKPYSHALDEYVGEYKHPAYGTIRIMLQDEGLHMQFNNNHMELKHLHYDIFIFELFGDTYPASFATAVDGSIASVSIPLEPTIDPLVFVKNNQSA